MISYAWKGSIFPSMLNNLKTLKTSHNLEQTQDMLFSEQRDKVTWIWCKSNLSSNFDEEFWWRGRISPLGDLTRATVLSNIPNGTTEKYCLQWMLSGLKGTQSCPLLPPLAISPLNHIPHSSILPHAPFSPHPHTLHSFRFSTFIQSLSADPVPHLPGSPSLLTIHLSSPPPS